MGWVGAVSCLDEMARVPVCSGSAVKSLKFFVQRLNTDICCASAFEFFLPDSAAKHVSVVVNVLHRTQVSACASVFSFGFISLSCIIIECVYNVIIIIRDRRVADCLWLRSTSILQKCPQPQSYTRKHTPSPMQARWLASRGKHQGARPTTKTRQI